MDFLVDWKAASSLPPSISDSLPIPNSTLRCTDRYSVSGKWLAQDSANARIQTLRFVFQRTRHQTTAFSTSEGAQVFFSCFTKNIETLGINLMSEVCFSSNRKWVLDGKRFRLTVTMREYVSVLSSPPSVLNHRLYKYWFFRLQWFSSFLVFLLWGSTVPFKWKTV